MQQPRAFTTAATIFPLLAAADHGNECNFSLILAYNELSRMKALQSIWLHSC